MDSRLPNEDELKKLQNIGTSFRHTVINIIILCAIYWIVRALLNSYPVVQISVYITLLPATFFLLLKMALLNRCPRCSAWGAPMMGGSCPKCGLRLSSINKKD
jgi:hypothetical protein